MYKNGSTYWREYRCVCVWEKKRAMGECMYKYVLRCAYPSYVCMCLSIYLCVWMLMWVVVQERKCVCVCMYELDYECQWNVKLQVPLTKYPLYQSPKNTMLIYHQILNRTPKVNKRTFPFPHKREQKLEPRFDVCLFFSSVGSQDNVAHCLVKIEYLS